jgi:hypothetical protein
MKKKSAITSHKGALQSLRNAPFSGKSGVISYGQLYTTMNENAERGRLDPRLRMIGNRGSAPSTVDQQGMIIPYVANILDSRVISRQTTDFNE